MNHVRSRPTGLALAAVTATISGVAVFVNGHGVRRFPDATTYTTAKNAFAALGVIALLLVAARVRPGSGPTQPSSPRERLGLVAVAVVGGSVPFVLFFEGLARATSTDAAFIHKTLVAWVAIFAVVRLRERVAPVHLAAIALLLAGQAQLRGGFAWPDLAAGEVLILAATWCWAAEVVVAKRLLATLSPLTVGAARMAGGTVVLVGWVAVTGRAGELVGLTWAQLGWVILTGTLLTGYVVTWHHALASAPAIDVTAVLVLGALVTALLDASVNGAALSPQAVGLLLIATGVVALIAGAGRRAGDPRVVAPVAT